MVSNQDIFVGPELPLWIGKGHALKHALGTFWNLKPVIFNSTRRGWLPQVSGRLL